MLMKSGGKIMSAAEYRESLRDYSPTVFIDGDRVTSVADDPRLAPGIRAVGVTYDFAQKPEYGGVMLAEQGTSGKTVNRMLHINRHSEDLLTKLEAVRLLCRESGCAQRYLTHDALNAIYQSTWRMADERQGSEYHDRFLDYLHDIQDRDLTLGVAMTDAKGERSVRPHAQENAGAYVHIKERRGDGIVLSGTKAIVTGGPYMHELLVMPCRTMLEADADFAVAALYHWMPRVNGGRPPAGRPGEAAAKFSARYGQSTAVCHFSDVFVPWDRVFMAGEWQMTEHLVTSYANHHRHSCIGARAGFGDLLIGAGALMTEANGLDADKVSHLRETMVELIKIVEGFYACGVAASVYGVEDPGGSWMPEPVFSNIAVTARHTNLRYAPHRP